MGLALVSRSARRRRGAGGGAWSCRGPAEHRSAGSRRHGERGPGVRFGGAGSAGAAPRTRARPAPPVPRGLPPAPPDVRAPCPEPGGGLRAAASPGFLAAGPTAPSPLTPPPFLPPSSPPPVSPPFLPGGSGFVKGLGGGRRCGAGGWLEPLPPPRPPAGSHLSWHPDAWRPGPCGSAGPGPRVSAGLGSLPLRLGEAGGQSPRPAHKFPSRRVWPRSRAHLSAAEAAAWAAPQSSGGRLAVCVLLWPGVGVGLRDRP